MDFRPKYFQVVVLWGVRGFLSGLGFFVCFVGCFFNFFFFLRTEVGGLGMQEIAQKHLTSFLLAFY